KPSDPRSSAAKVSTACTSFAGRSDPRGQADLDAEAVTAPEELVMTRPTFSEHLQAYDRLWRCIIVPEYLLLILAFAAGPPLARVLLGPPEAPEELRVWVLVVSSLMAGVALLLMVVSAWGTRWTARKFGLLCPSCAAPLTGRNRHAALGAG